MAKIALKMKIDNKNYSAFKENDSLNDKRLQELFLMEPMGFTPTASPGAPPRMARRKRARSYSRGMGDRHLEI